MALIADRVELARRGANDGRIFGASPVGIAENGALRRGCHALQVIAELN